MPDTPPWRFLSRKPAFPFNRGDGTGCSKEAASATCCHPLLGQIPRLGVFLSVLTHILSHLVIADAGSPSAVHLGDSKTDGMAWPHTTTNNSAKRRYRKRKRASYNNLLPSKGSTADNFKKVEGVEMLLIIERSCRLRSQATCFSNKFSFLSKTFLLSQPSKIQKVI